MCSKKFHVAFVDPEIVVLQRLHLALRLPTGLSGTDFLLFLDDISELCYRV